MVVQEGADNGPFFTGWGLSAGRLSVIGSQQNADKAYRNVQLAISGVFLLQSTCCDFAKAER
jgi:hypothetical protein